MFIFTSSVLSGPLTLLSAPRSLPHLAEKESLKVHIAGAEAYDIQDPFKWEHLAHRLPALKRLDIRFVGPLIKGNNKTTKSKTCDGCSKLGRVITTGFYQMLYQQFRKLKDFSAPDLVLVQNCGFHEEWNEEGLQSLLLQTGAPVIFTSYTRTEALSDLKRFQEFCGQEVEVLVQCEENKMRSYRPRRYVIGLDEEIDVFYRNFYINMVKVKQV